MSRRGRSIRSRRLTLDRLEARRLFVADWPTVPIADPLAHISLARITESVHEFVASLAPGTALPPGVGERVAGLDNVWRLRVPDGDVECTLPWLRADANVHFVEPMQQVGITLDPNTAYSDDSQFGALWGLQNTGQNGGTVDADIDAPAAWDLEQGSSQVVVANIDTGVEYTHIDLYKNIWINQAEIPGGVAAQLVDVDADGWITFWDLAEPINQGPGKITDLNGNSRIDGGDLLFSAATGGWADGVDDGGNAFVDDLIGWDFVNNDNDPNDDHGHGTHTSGTIGAIGNNHEGVVGVAHRAQIMVLKSFDQSGSGTDLDGARAIDYSVAEGARVSSNSWGSSATSTVLDQALQSSLAAGQIFVAAAGNNARNIDTSGFYPAGYPYANIVSVAASDRLDQLASFSNYGFSQVDLAAPGASILSTFRNDAYKTWSGTSMATPHVAGAAVLLLAQQPAWTSAEAITRLLATVDPIPALASKVATGGRLNLGRALELPALADTPGSGTDLVFVDAHATGFATVTVTYEVRNEDAQPFELGFYESADLQAGDDALLSRLRIAAPSDLSVGVHVKTFALGDGLQQTALLGAGLVDTDTDYNILVVLDRLRTLAEDDLDAWNEDNTGSLQGSYQLPGGTVMVLGSPGSDSISWSTSGANLLLDLNGNIRSYNAASVPEIRVRASAGNDVVTAAGINKPVKLWGSEGDDALQGGALNDTLHGGAGADRWISLGTPGNDTMAVSIDGTTGRWKIVRGTETDRFVFDTDDRIEIRGGMGNDKLDVASNISNGADLFGEAGNDSLYGGAGDDQLTGDIGDDTLTGRLGTNAVFGGTGNDAWTFEGTSGNDFLDIDWDALAARVIANQRVTLGGPVVDFTTAVGAERLTALGQAGNDRLDLSLLSVADRTLAGLTNVTSDGGSGNDTLLGSSGNDTLRGNTGNDQLVDDLGNDSLDGGPDADTLSSGAGNDTLFGRTGDDVLDGGAGSDTWIQEGTSAVDVLDADWNAGLSRLVVERRLISGGAVAELDSASGVEVLSLLAREGNDTINLSLLSSADVTAAGLTQLTPDGGPGNDLLWGSDFRDSLIGGTGQDTLHGSLGNDTLTGGDGDDQIDGGDGNDRLNGGNNNDLLLGALGDDTLDGGAGIDTLNGGAGVDTGINGETLIDIP